MPIPAPKTDDFVTLVDLQLFLHRWWKVACICGLVGAVVGLVYGMMKPRIYESLTFIPVDSSAGPHIQDPVQMNAALSKAFNQPRLADAFASTFFTYLDKVASESGPHSEEAKRAGTYFAGRFFHSSMFPFRGNDQSVDGDERVRRMAGYINRTGVSLLLMTSTGDQSLLQADNLFFISGHDSTSWQLQLRGEQQDISSVTAAAAGKALGTVALLYNERVIKLKESNLRLQLESARTRYTEAQKALTAAELESESERTRIKVEFYRLLIDVAKLEGKGGGFSVPNVGMPPFVASLVDSGKTSGQTDIGDTLFAFGMNDLSKRLANLADRKADPKTMDDFLKRLSKLETSKSAVKARTDSLEATFRVAKTSYETALGAVTAPIDRSEFAIAGASVEDLASEKPGTRLSSPVGSGLGRSAAIGLFSGLLIFAMAIFANFSIGQLQRRPSAA